LSRLSPAGGGDVIALASPLLLAKEDCRRAGLWPNHSQFFLLQV